MGKDLVEREAVRAEKEVELGLGKASMVGGAGIGIRWFTMEVVVLKRRVLEVWFLRGRDNKLLLLLGLMKGNENFCIPSAMHFPPTLFSYISSAKFRTNAAADGKREEIVCKQVPEGFRGSFLYCK